MLLLVWFRKGLKDMRFVINAGGSRGDITPFLAVGQQLANQGHTVVAGMAPVYEALVKNCGLAFAPIGPLITRREVTAMVFDSIEHCNPGDQWLTFVKHFGPLIPSMFSDLYRLCQDADALIGHFFFGLPNMIHDTLGTPYVSLRMSDFCEDDPHVRSQAAIVINDARKQLNLPLLRDPYGRDGHSNLLSMYTSSPYLTGRNDAAGFFFVESKSPPLPDDVEKFLAKDSRPILISFGSMIFRNPAVLLDNLLKAVEITGERVIIQTGSWLTRSVYGERESSTVKFVGPMAHEILLRRVGFVIHHGGGIITECLRQGVPSIPIPYTCDNFLWSALLVERGAAPVELPFRELTVSKLVNAIRSMRRNYAQYSRRCERISKIIQMEPGVREGTATIISRLHPSTG